MLLNKSENPAVLVKPDGTRISINVEIQSNIAFMSDINIPIEVDDIIERSRGAVTDKFLVTNVDINDEEEPYSLLEPGIEANIKPFRKERSTDNTLNIHSITADRVYINATDNSTNISVFIG